MKKFNKALLADKEGKHSVINEEGSLEGSPFKPIPKGIVKKNTDLDIFKNRFQDSSSKKKSNLGSVQESELEKDNESPLKQGQESKYATTPIKSEIGEQAAQYSIIEETPERTPSKLQTQTRNTKVIDNPSEDLDNSDIGQYNYNGQDITFKYEKLAFTEEEYESRKCENAHFRLKFIEDKALAIGDRYQMINTHIIAAGVRYGAGEDKLKSIVQQALDCEKLVINGDSEACMPTIHVEDLAKIVLRLIKKRYYYPYIFGVDKNTEQSLGSILRGLSQKIGSGEVEYKSTFTIDDPMPFWTMDIPTKSSPFLEDTKNEWEDMSTFNLRSFNWTSQV